MSEWQPIETAPDRCGVLICCCFSEWVTAGQKRDGAWYELNNDPSDHWGGELFPTHWMLFPEPPVAP